MERKWLLMLVFDFVGSGYYLYTAPVQKRWHRHYREGHGTGTWAGAAVTGNVQCLREALHNGFDFNLKAKIKCSGAVMEKSISYLAGLAASREVLLLAKEHGMKWDTPALCTGAARAGRLELLQELHETLGCPLGNLIGLSAARAPNSASVLIYLHKNGKLEMLDFKSLMLAAAQSGNETTAEWLISQGASWGKYVTFEAACYNQTRFILWASSKGCSTTWAGDDCSRARRAGASAHTMEWLHSQKTFVCDCRRR
jgi:hypothetical protein